MERENECVSMYRDIPHFIFMPNFDNIADPKNGRGKRTCGIFLVVNRKMAIWLCECAADHIS